MIFKLWMAKQYAVYHVHVILDYILFSITHHHIEFIIVINASHKLHTVNGAKK